MKILEPDSIGSIIGWVSIFKGKASDFVVIVFLALSITASVAQAAIESVQHIYGGQFLYDGNLPELGNNGWIHNVYFQAYAGGPPLVSPKFTGATGYNDLVFWMMANAHYVHIVFNSNNFEASFPLDYVPFPQCVNNARNTSSTYTNMVWSFHAAVSSSFGTHGCTVDYNCPLASPAYTYNPATRLCERQTQDVLSITLSGGSTEPWHKKHDQNHEKSNLPFMAIVTDQNGQAKAGVSVNITTDITSDSGGHVHTYGRPKGKLIAGTPVSTLGGTATISGTTDSTGAFSFTFGAEEASGEHKLTAICTGCTAPTNASVNVLIPGLMLLDADPLGYILRGDLPEHPDNHYFSGAAIVRIINLAHAYQLNTVFNKELLKINDSSLVKGGVFDINQDWTHESNRHGGHRVGIVVDINNYHATNLLFEEFASRKHIQANWHGKGTAPHYHLLLLGRDN